MPRNVVITGYPKSGTHWVSRLTAELIGAPLEGNWGHVGPSRAAEGLERRSPFACYKAHHTGRDLQTVWDRRADRIVYVIRDPRDVVLSGAHFFRFPLPVVDRIPMPPLAVIGRFKWRLNDVVSLGYKRRRMIRAVLDGDGSISPLCAVSWRDHHSSFEGIAVLVVRYEDLLRQPFVECRRILGHVGVDVDEASIEACVRNQSFDVRRQEEAPGRYRVLRKGESSAWRHEMPLADVLRIEQRLAPDLRRFGYPLHSDADG